MHPIFHERAFAAAIRAGDSKRFGLDLKNARQEILNAALTHASTLPIRLGPYHEATIKGRPCKSLPDYSQNLILRIAAGCISRRFRVETSSRDRKVVSLIEALTDATPFFILRRDIKSFYESIPTVDIRHRLAKGSELPPVLRDVVEEFFASLCRGATVGLPRGICLSAVLAELAMQDFDARVRAYKGVFRYFRYSDDIIILTYLDPSALEAALPNLLTAGMVFNSSKSLRIDVTSQSGQASRKQFEYLGYRFSFSNSAGGKEARSISVAIADKKISKIKTRLISAFKAHATSPDFTLLEKRIRFLAGNVVVLRQGVAAIKSSRFVKSGIYYNYKLCGNYKNGTIQPHPADELKGIDGFYRSLVKKFSVARTGLSALEQTALRRISFYKGYVLRHTARYSAVDIQKIKSVWKNV